MTIATAYWCILIAALLPYVWVYVAKTAAPKYNNMNPRAWVAKQTDNYKLQRAYNAHLNALEAFAPFVAGVLMAQFAGVADATIAGLAIAFVALRVLHGVFYLANAALLRSLVWLGSFGCAIALIALAALAAA